MGLKQRFYRPKLTDLYLDTLIKRLIKHHRLEDESQLLTKLLLEADKQL